MQQLSVILLALICALVTTAGQVALKFGVSSPSLSALLASGQTLHFLLTAVATPMVLGGLVLYGLSAVLWLLVLARAELSYAFPLVSLGFVFSAVYGHFGMQEHLSAMRIAGIFFIVVGVVCVARS